MRPITADLATDCNACAKRGRAVFTARGTQRCYSTSSQRPRGKVGFPASVAPGTTLSEADAQAITQVAPDPQPDRRAGRAPADVDHMGWDGQADRAGRGAGEFSHDQR